MCISIPLRRIVNVNDLGALNTEPVYDREGGLVNFDITVVPVLESGRQLASTSFTSHWVLKAGKEADGITAEGLYDPSLNIELKKTARSTFFIVLKEEMATDVREQRSNILDYTNFGTHGYIPVWSTREDARRALNVHCGKDVNGRKEFKLYIEDNSKLYHRPDHHDKWKHKLFFPIPLSAELGPQELKQRYMQLYQKTCPWQKRFDWHADFAKLRVVELQVT